MNIVGLSGRLTADPELKALEQDRCVSNFTLAVQSKKKDSEGNYISDFISCTAWGQPARFLSSYGNKGDYVEITGSIHNANYTDKEGVKHYKDNVTVQDLKIVSRRSQNASGDVINAGVVTTPSATKNLSQLAQFAEVTFEQTSIDDGELPF